MKIVRELDLFEIMVRVRFLGIYFLMLYLVLKVVLNNLDVLVMIDWLLCFFVVYLVCICKLVKDEIGRELRIYGLGNVGKKFIKDEYGIFIVFYVFFYCLYIKGVIWYDGIY